MNTKHYGSIQTIKVNLQKSEQAMGNGELAAAFEMIENIMKQIDLERVNHGSKNDSVEEKAFFTEITNRCVFLKRKLIKEMAQNL